MTAKWIRLREWVKATFGDDPPHINTIRNWIRDGKISPPPKKHGRDYYFRPDAEYVDTTHTKPSLLTRIGRAA
jgi:hypothetical protein